MLIDSHMHMGQFFNDYFTAKYVYDFTRICEINKFLVSSTSTCENDIEKVLKEFKRLYEIAKGHILPCLWLTETILDSPKYNLYFESGIHWYCIKIHPSLYPNEWQVGSAKMKSLISLAHSLEIPLLIHTGYDIICRSDKYEKEIASNPDVMFILAHGRPLDASLTILKSYPNVYVDTAFMSPEDIVKLVKLGYENRILWGSDFPIYIIYYPKINPIYYYRHRLNYIKKRIDSSAFAKITYRNAVNLFKIGI